jgi:hypothetical protein
VSSNPVQGEVYFDTTLCDGFSGITKPSGILVPPGVVSPTQNLSQSYLKKYIAKLLQLNGRKNISL